MSLLLGGAVIAAAIGLLLGTIAATLTLYVALL